VRRIVGATAVLVLLVAGAVAALLSRDSSSAPGAPPRVRLVDVGQSARPTELRTLFVLEGYHYGPLGRFVVSCTRAGIPQTRYVTATHAPTTLIAVDGRGVARGAKLGLEGRSLSGGSSRSGIEHWIVSTGGEPEELRLDASLVAFSEASAPGACEFSLRGRLELTLH
jgi:hypothetical protein